MPLENIPINKKIVDEVIDRYGISDLGKATIREISSIVTDIESVTNVKFHRMEMGVPGLTASEVGLGAQIEALKRGVASKYPKLEGEAIFKTEASRFIKAFLNLDIDPIGCIPTVGSMQGGFAAFLVLSKLDSNKDTVLFIDPGFPVQKIQLQTLGIKYESFDVYHYRGDKLQKKLKRYLSKGNISSIIYSNPNNPSWISFTEQELQIIGNLASEFNAIVIEDLAYFGMDFRNDYSVPFQPPFQPSVGRYCSNYLLLISGSKAFSYAGERIALLAISNSLREVYSDSLKYYFGLGDFGRVLVGRVLYALSAGTSHSAQLAMAAIFKAANDGDYNFIEPLKEYAKRANRVKQLFIDAGFDIIYDTDINQPIADGFYFTAGIKNMNENELIHRLLYHGISAIPLHSTGSEFDGVRICVSQIHQNRMNDLEIRLQCFKKNLSQNP